MSDTLLADHLLTNGGAAAGADDTSVALQGSQRREHGAAQLTLLRSIIPIQLGCGDRPHSGGNHPVPESHDTYMS